MNESAITFGSQSLIGVLCEPETANGAAVIFVNAGSTHRCGPNRVYTILARHLASWGYTSLRFDIAGIGDSPAAVGLGKFRDYAARQVQEAMDYLGQTKYFERFVIFGLCGGADIAFDAGAIDERVKGLILINGAFVDGDVFADLYHKANSKTINRFYASRWFSPRRWWRLITFQSKFWNRFFHHGKTSTSPQLACGQPTVEMASTDSRQKWMTLAQRNVDILLIYSEGSVFWDLYKAANRDYLKTNYPANCLTVAFHKNTDHTYTLLSAQDRLINQIKTWLAEQESEQDERKQAVATVGDTA